MTDVHTVLVNGVRYAPVTDAHIDARELMRALVATYHGEVDPDEESELYGYYRVSVGEMYEQGDAWDGAPTVADFVADVMERLARTRSGDRPDSA